MVINTFLCDTIIKFLFTFFFCSAVRIVETRLTHCIRLNYYFFSFKTHVLLRYNCTSDYERSKSNHWYDTHLVIVPMVLIRICIFITLCFSLQLFLLYTVFVPSLFGTRFSTSRARVTSFAHVLSVSIRNTTRDFYGNNSGDSFHVATELFAAAIIVAFFSARKLITFVSMFFEPTRVPPVSRRPVSQKPGPNHQALALEVLARGRQITK